jgi:hypothetical protein
LLLQINHLKIGLLKMSLNWRIDGFGAEMAPDWPVQSFFADYMYANLAAGRTAVANAVVTAPQHGERATPRGGALIGWNDGHRPSRAITWARLPLIVLSFGA